MQTRQSQVPVTTDITTIDIVTVESCSAATPVLELAAHKLTSDVSGWAISVPHKAPRQMHKKRITAMNNHRCLTLKRLNIRC